MEKTLITGGSGFIGSHFHNDMDQSMIVNLDLEEPRFNYSSEFIRGDIRKEEDIRRAIQGKTITRIISLAAKHHDFGIGHDEYFDTNEEGTRTLCKVAEENNIKEIVFYSTVAVYGPVDGQSNEQISPLPNSPYGASKLAGEEVLKAWAARDKTRKSIILRPTVVFGPNNLANMYNLIRQIDSGLYFHLGKANNFKSIAYVENVVQATLFLADRAHNGVSIYNYADEPQLTARQIADTISAALGRKISFTLPMPLAIIIAFPFDMVIRLTGRNLPVSAARIRKLATQTLHSAGKVSNEGFKPAFSTVDGLIKTVQWYKSIKSKAR
jgi:nucleoside-diphosphate-sugar epimerase